MQISAGPVPADYIVNPADSNYVFLFNVNLRDALPDLFSSAKFSAPAKPQFQFQLIYASIFQLSAMLRPI